MINTSIWFLSREGTLLFLARVTKLNSKDHGILGFGERKIASHLLEYRIHVLPFPQSCWWDQLLRRREKHNGKFRRFTFRSPKRCLTVNKGQIRLKKFANSGADNLKDQISTLCIFQNWHVLVQVIFRDWLQVASCYSHTTDGLWNPWSMIYSLASHRSAFTFHGTLDPGPSNFEQACAFGIW